MLSVKNLSKKYGSLEVIRQVSLDIAQGELVAITGASGAGKSTLLHLMGGLDVADSGSVFIDGQELTKLNAKKQAQFRNQKLGFVFQFHHLLPEFNAQENVAMPLWIAGSNYQSALKEAAQLLEVVGLKERLLHKPASLSGGEQQRVAIARALIMKPAIVLADEPTGNLDSANAAQIHQLFFDLREKLGQTMVVVTHNNNLAVLCDRNIEMRDGQIIQVHHRQEKVS